MAKKKRTFSNEFFQEAVRYYRQSGLSYAEAAKKLEVSESSLCRWDKQTAVDNGEREGLTTTEREELRRLRRENRELREERTILKKATAFFAKENR